MPAGSAEPTSAPEFDPEAVFKIAGAITAALSDDFVMSTEMLEGMDASNLAAASVMLVKYMVHEWARETYRSPEDLWTAIAHSLLGIRDME